MAYFETTEEKLQRYFFVGITISWFIIVFSLFVLTIVVEQHHEMERKTLKKYK